VSCCCKIKDALAGNAERKGRNSLVFNFASSQPLERFQRCRIRVIVECAAEEQLLARMGLRQAETPVVRLCSPIQQLILAADVDHAARGLLESRLADVVSRFFFLDY
jgi:hypothetical protein